VNKLDWRHLSLLEKLAGILFVVSCSAFVTLALVKDAPFLPEHTWLFANSLEKVRTPLALITLVTLGYLVYFYRHRAEQAELALHQLNTALESSHELMDRLTISDALTDTLNRSGMEKFIAQDFFEAEQMGMPIIALIADCDGFRQINQRFGREAGDAVLQEIAARLKRSARRCDRIARVDSDQFLILLREITVNDAQAVAERIAIAVANQPITVGSRNLTASVSLGMSILPRQVASLAEILELTMPSLQKSKSLRKGKVL
jgi:diguanylate cyclase (GGDEF)-like protein